MTDIISIQSQVVHGHVGNSAAVFPMQAKGLTVASVPTALLSNHPHYPTLHGRILDSEFVAALLQGVEERGLLDSARLIVTGYLGSVGNGGVVARFIERARRHNPGLTYVCDPVMGDDDLGVFVQEGLVEVFRDRLVPLADVITPNLYELELLVGAAARTEAALDTAMRRLQRRGTHAAAVTGCVLEDSRPGDVETVTWMDGRLSRTGIGRLPIRPCGTGDLFTALFAARLWAGEGLHAAGRAATHEIHAVLKRTHAHDSEEMLLAGFPFAPLAAEAEP